MALVGTMGGLMINKRGGRKRQEKVRGRMKAIKGENTEQRAKQKEDPASPQREASGAALLSLAVATLSTWCARVLWLPSCLCLAVTAGCCWPHQKTQHFLSGKTENKNIAWGLGFF